MIDQYEVKDKAVTLYLNGFAHISAEAEIKAAAKKIELTGFPDHANLESFHTLLGSKNLKILEARVVEPTTLREIAENQIGKQVYDGNEIVKIVGVQGDQVWVKGVEGLCAKPLTAFYYKLKEDIRKESALELQLEGLKKRGEQILELSYLTEGLSITPHYNINLADNKLNLAAEIKVENNSGKAFENVDFEVVPGEVRQPYFPTRHSARLGRIMSIAYVATAEETEIFEEKGQIRYSFGKKNLPKGESKFSVFSINKLGYDILYKAEIEHFGKNEITTTLKFKSPITLPQGSVAVFGEKLKGQQTTEQYEGGGTLPNVLKNKNAEISLRTPDTLEMKLELVDQKIVQTDLGTAAAPLYAVEKEAKVKISNAGKENVIIETCLELGETQRFLETSLKQSPESSEKQIKWDIKVKARGEKEFTYKLQDIKFVPAPRDALKA